MKNIGLKLAGAFLATVLTSLSYGAALTNISGRIDIGAYASTALIDFGANSVAFSGGSGGFNAQVTNSSGDYLLAGMVAAPVGTKVNYSAFNYTVPFSPAGQTIWSINGTTYFKLNTLIVVDEEATGRTLGLTGIGTASLTGYLDTPGQWSFSADRVTGQTNFSFSSTTQVPPPAVPDGGSSIALLGAALSALGLIARARRLG